MNPLRVLNLGLAFVLEIAALAALACWGFRAGGTPVTRVLLGVGTPLVAAVAWGLFAAPKARVRVPALRLAVKIAVFGGAAVALAAAGHPTLAVTYAVVVVINTVLLAWLGPADGS